MSIGWFKKFGVYGFVSLITALIIIFSNLAPSYSLSIPELIFRGIQIIQISNLSDGQEVRLGQQINKQLLRSGQVRIYNNRQINRYIEDIGFRLAQSSDRPNIPYTFQVVRDKNINAFATMGGFVYINTGLIAVADNEAELASVIAHEIGHIAGRHVVERMQQQAIAQGLLSVAGLDESQAVQLGVEVAFNLPNSREAELEADQMGLTNLERADYAPIGMIDFMKKLAKYSGSAPSFLSSHPATSDRILALEAEVNPSTASLGDGLNNQAYQQEVRFIKGR